MPTIAHFEIPANDVMRAQKFYSGLFNWKFESGGGDYYMTETTGEGGNKVAAGLYKKQDAQEPIMDYIGVSSVSESLDKVLALGGKVITPKTAAAGYGYWATFQDTENNTFGLWEANKNAQ